MDPFQVLAFDPGKATGWAHFIYKGRGDYEFSSGTIWDEEHHRQIQWLIESHMHIDKPPLTVISESFEFRQAPGSAQNQRRGLELVSREYIGIMKLICADLCIPFKQQQPSHRNFIDHEKLDRLNLFPTPLYENRHRIDALQHLCYYLVVTKRVEEIRSGIKRSRNVAS